MEVFFNKAFMNILIWILRLLDGIYDFFMVLAGIRTVRDASGTETGLVEYFLESPAVAQVFWSIFLISVAVCFICIIVAIVKNTINLKGEQVKSHARTVGQGLFSIVISVAMAAVMLVGITLSNRVLYLINISFSEGEEVSMAVRVFDMSVEGGYLMERKIDEETGEEYYTYKIGEDKERMPDPDGGWYRDSNDNLFSAKDLNFINPNKPLDNANTVYGSFRKNALGLEDENKYNNDGKIKMDSFNFIVAYFGALVLIVSLSMSCLGLIKRLYDLVLLFLALPLVSATIPLDDGAKFKLWRETVVSKVVLAYGTVFAVNVFVIAMPLVLNLVITTGFMNNIFQLLLLVGGALSISGGQLLFARLLGTSAEEHREMMQGVRSIVAGGAMAMGAGKGIKNAIFGGHDKFGHKHQGALKIGAKAAAGTVNAVGSALGGNAYRSFAQSTTKKATGLASALKGRYMEKGGLIGAPIQGVKYMSDAAKTKKNKELALHGYEQLQFSQDQLKKNNVIILPSDTKPPKNTKGDKK